MWRPLFRRRWARPSLRERLNDYALYKEMEEGRYDYYGPKSGEPFFISLFKAMHSQLLPKITVSVVLVLVTSLLSNWRHPIALRLTDSIQYVTSWNMDFRQFGQEVMPVMRSLWEGNPEIGLVKPVISDHEDWQAEVVEQALLLPVKGEISAAYGLRLHPLWGREEMHYGIDLSAEASEEVLAPLKGKVLRIDDHPYFYKLLYLEHGDGFSTVYGHVDNIQLSVGQVVEKGQKIASIRENPPGGAARLHFELRSQGKPVDPLPYLKDSR